MIRLQLSYEKNFDFYCCIFPKILKEKRLNISISWLFEGLAKLSNIFLLWIRQEFHVFIFHMIDHLDFISLNLTQL